MSENAVKAAAPRPDWRPNHKPPAPVSGLFISEQEVADYFGAHLNTMARLRKKHRLPHLLIGSRVMYRRDSLDDIEKRAFARNADD